MNPSIQQKERIVSLDIIRGLALFGILFINVGAYKVLIEGGSMPDTSGINHVIQSLIDVFIQKKFFSMFSFLFGVGFYIFATRAEARGDKPRWRFARRLLALLLIGIIHIVIFWGSILAIYAVIGFLLLPFYNKKVSTIRNCLLILISMYTAANVAQLFGAQHLVLSLVVNEAVIIFCMFLSGLFVAKAGWLTQMEHYAKKIKWLQLITGFLFIGFSLGIWFTTQNDSIYGPQLVSLGVIPMTYFYLICLFKLFAHQKVAQAFQPIGRVGQMAFTNYIAQSFLGLGIMKLMGLEVVSASQIVIIACLVFSIQIIFSVIWFKFFTMGPLEKLWRRMTYGKTSKQVSQQ
ncbi:DUF418 domain-containing protein [Lysinibacillus piscis]|uniref:Membrane protein n=1 Tax=Lysinibacillus piscis TaxID=2518931 RepID=A0ABQ5NFN6_9BACI|nr:DUF418 domain-containing protein [Lysinibacillus sp. KH24]GLC87189.1 membrane protein [Lysinibacillus sp. KH24]